MINTSEWVKPSTASPGKSCLRLKKKGDKKKAKVVKKEKVEVAEESEDDEKMEVGEEQNEKVHTFSYIFQYWVSTFLIMAMKVTYIRLIYSRFIILIAGERI